MLETLDNYIKTTIVPNLTVLLKTVQTNIYLYGPVVYLCVISIVVMFFYLKTYKGVIKNYCGDNTKCYDSFRLYAKLGDYIVLLTVVYLIYVGTSNSIVLATLTVSGIVGFTYMKDAWKVSIDGAVYDESEEWTVCRLIRKYAPYNPTIAERLRIVTPIASVVMFFLFMYLLSIIGMTGDEMPYFIMAVLAMFGLIAYKTHQFIKNVENVASVITFEMNATIFVVFQIRSPTVDGGNYLIATPGGPVDDDTGESSQQAAERQTAKETGISIKLQRIGTVLNDPTSKHGPGLTTNQPPKTGIYFAHAATIPQTRLPEESKQDPETMTLQTLEEYLNKRVSRANKPLGQKDIPAQDISTVIESFEQIQQHIHALGPKVYAAPLELLVNNNLVWEPSRRCLQLVDDLIKSNAISADYHMPTAT